MYGMQSLRFESQRWDERSLNVCLAVMEFEVYVFGLSVHVMRMLLSYGYISHPTQQQQHHHIWTSEK